MKRSLFVLLTFLLVFTSVLAPCPDFLSRFGNFTGGGLQVASAADLAVDNITTSTSDNATLSAFQRKIVYAASNFWALFTNGTNLVMYSSLDGDTWNSQGTIKASVTEGYTASIWYDSENICIAYASGTPNTALQYRQYEPNDDGTLTALPSHDHWETVHQAEGSETYLYPFVCKDTSGYPVVTFSLYDGEHYHPWIMRAEQNNGQWTSSDIDQALTETDDSTWRSCVVPVASQDLLFIYAQNTATIKSKLYDDSASTLRGENATTSAIEFSEAFSVVVTDDNVTHMVFEYADDDIVYTHYHSGGTAWETEEDVYVGSSATKAPVLSKTLDDNLYCFWMGDNVTDHIYYKAQVGGTWDTTKTDWLTESSITDNASISCAYEMTTTNYISVMWLTGAGSPYNVRFGGLDLADTDPSFVTGFSHRQSIDITNSSGVAQTNPVVAIPIIPYAPVRRHDSTVDGNLYRYAIPFTVNNMSDENLTNYETRIGPIDTRWLVDAGWACADGDEIRFVEDDYSTELRFWLEEDPGWDQPDTSFWVELDILDGARETIYLLCDPLLTAVASESTTAIFDFYEGFSVDSVDTWTNLMGDCTYDVANVSSDYTVMVKWTATATGSCNYLQVRVSYEVNIKVSVYDDDGAGGAPSTRLAKRDTSYLCAAGLNYVPLESSCSITSGQSYWLGFNTAATHLRRTTTTGVGTAKYKANTYATWTWANPIDLTGYGDLTYDYSIAAYNFVDFACTGWTATGDPVISGGVLSVNGSGEALQSDTTYGTGHALRSYTYMNDHGGASTGSRFGFYADDNNSIRFRHTDTASQHYETYSMDGGSLTSENNQYPWDLGGWVLYDIARRTPSTNKSIWARFQTSNILLTDSPIWSNVDNGSMALNFVSASIEIKSDWILVRDYVSPEPIVEIPQLYHDLNTTYLGSDCEHWPYDIAFTKSDNSTQLYYHIDKATYSSEYATEVYVKYDGTINNGETVNINVYYGNATQSSLSSYADDGSDVFDFWDNWDSGDETAWTEVSGTWATSDQQRPQVFDYHLMNTNTDISSLWGGTPIITCSDNIERFIGFAGSWGGATVNRKGDMQWAFPWQFVLYEKHGESWYRFGNVLQAEYNGSTTGSMIPYWAWEGDGADMGTDGWIYLSASGSMGYGGTYLFANKDGTMKTWEVLNAGVPVANGDTDADNVRFTHIVYEGGAYYLLYASLSMADVRFMYNNTAGEKTTFLSMLNDTGGTIDPDTFWDGGVDIITGWVAQGVETPWIYKDPTTDNWTMLIESINGRNLYYSFCDGDNFTTTMDTGDWTTPALMTDLDDVYAWSSGDLATPMLSSSGGSPILVYNGDGADYVSGGSESTKTVAFATNTSYAGTGWTPENIDKERSQSTTGASWSISYATGENITKGVISSSVTLDGVGLQDGLVWRYQDANNFYAFYMSASGETVYYNKMSGGVWGTPVSYDTGEGQWFGEEWRLRILFDGATTTLQYSKTGGWEWLTAWSGLTLTDVNIPTSGYYGTCTYDAKGYFDDFSVGPYSAYLTGQGSTELDITVQPDSLTGSWAYKEGAGAAVSKLRENTWYTTETSLATPLFTITNQGSATIDCLIYSSDNWTGTGITWHVSPTGDPGDHTIGLWVGLDSDSGYGTLIKPEAYDVYNFLLTNLAALAHDHFGLAVFTCTSNGGNASMSGTVTLTAVVHT